MFPTNQAKIMADFSSKYRLGKISEYPDITGFTQPDTLTVERLGLFQGLDIYLHHRYDVHNIR